MTQQPPTLPIQSSSNNLERKRKELDQTADMAAPEEKRLRQSRINWKAVKDDTAMPSQDDTASLATMPEIVLDPPHIVAERERWERVALGPRAAERIRIWVYTDNTKRIDSELPYAERVQQYVVNFTMRQLCCYGFFVCEEKGLVKCGSCHTEFHNFGPPPAVLIEGEDDDDDETASCAASNDSNEADEIMVSELLDFDWSDAELALQLVQEFPGYSMTDFEAEKEEQRRMMERVRAVDRCHDRRREAKKKRKEAFLQELEAIMEAKVVSIEKASAQVEIASTTPEEKENDLQVQPGNHYPTCQRADCVPDECPLMPKFHLFLKLAPELRERVYKHALVSDRPIRPHLCGQVLKFHDDNQPLHNATYAMLGITQVSKQVRLESLPMFYAANTFVVDKDTPAFFDHLEFLDRFHMIRQVQFTIVQRREICSAETLRGMKQYLKAKDDFERAFHTEIAAKQSLRTTVQNIKKVKGLSTPPTHAPRSLPSLSALIGSNFRSLTSHPQHLFGGLPELNALITLRKLTSAFPSPLHPEKLVLPVPRASIFTEIESLKWFPIVAHGLGIHLHFLEDIPLDYMSQGVLGLTWKQRWQKKDFHDSEGGGGGDDGASSATSEEAGRGVVGISAEEVRERTVAMFPDALGGQPVRNAYYRTLCRRSGITWYHIPVEGEEISGAASI